MPSATGFEILRPKVEEVLLQSPLGPLRLTASPAGLRSIEFLQGEPQNVSRIPTQNPRLTLLVAELIAYFEGKLTRFSCQTDLVGTEFQKRVWKLLATIPYGCAISYGGLAEKLGQPGAARAVGGAANKNPLPIVIPCHRILGARSELIGFAAGVWRKQWLLEHEGIALPLR